ncbi:MAG: Asp-tRNA(Asn)/Glu-tRNA(Gln) amidotransferase subunit GatC [Gammaproteobacteria bacterium]|nr:MAG: Asp-tRNA(Asn)/Glu-tRNA(Gln) amidotransferase subunit GatC [Gammaproteobacteria bacterium]
MNLDRSTVDKIAHLARLAIAEEDVPRYVRDLSRILDLVERMNAVDTREVEPMAHPLDIPQRLRPDEVTEEDRREEYLALAPQAEAGHFLVPRVIE